MQRLFAILLLASALSLGPAVARQPLAVKAAEAALSAAPEAAPSAAIVAAPAVAPTPAPPFQVGIASWYGAWFQGKETTDGEHFNMYAMTAAHRTLPFGTRVRVTNLLNRRSIVLRINDRGPVPTSRVIDLSWGAARAIGFYEDGLIPVRIDIVPPAGKR